MIQKNFPKVEIIKNDKNLGFAKANNQGIKQSFGKYILLLNSDTEIKNDVAPKDTTVKTTMQPAIKDSALALPPSPKETPSESGSGQISYKVQFMSTGQRVPMLSDKFKGLKDVGEYQDGTAYKYTAGEFRTLEEAMKYRGEMQGKGFKDCFVVKFKDGKRLKN